MKKKWVIIVVLLFCVVLIGYYFYPQYFNFLNIKPKEKNVSFPFTYIKDVEGHKFEITILTFERAPMWAGDYQVLATFKHLGHRAITLESTGTLYAYGLYRSPLSLHFELYTNRGNYHESYLYFEYHWFAPDSFNPEEEGNGRCSFNTREDEYPLTLKILEKDAIYVFKLSD